MPFSLLWAALRGHRSSLVLAFILFVGWTGALRLSPSVVAAVMATALGGWWIFEAPVLRAWGARQPSTCEQMRLNGVRWRILVRDDPTVTVGSGLRTLRIATGALEIFDDDQINALLMHQSARIAAGDAIGTALAWLGALPFALGWYVTRGILALGRLLAASCATALVVPAIVCPTWWTTWVGRVFGAWLTLILGLWLMDIGIQTQGGTWLTAGLALLSGWFVTPLLVGLVARDARRAELAADRAVVEAGLADPLRSALELLAAVEPPVAPGPWPTLLHDRTSIEERIQAIQT
jgi:Zn-dependent protease with chaperone function